MFSKATALVHHWVQGHVRPGDTVVDATCGNGHDTLFLARVVGTQGTVVAVDIQLDAIGTTRAKLEKHGIQEQVRLHCLSHDRLGEVLPGGASVRCALFNLGYLPGGDKSLTTLAATSVKAHHVLLGHLEEEGVIISTVYTAHPGGQEEAAALLKWSRTLDGKQYAVAQHQWINQDGLAPFILIIQRRPARGRGAVFPVMYL